MIKNYYMFIGNLCNISPLNLTKEKDMREQILLYDYKYFIYPIV